MGKCFWEGNTRRSLDCISRPTFSADTTHFLHGKYILKMFNQTPFTGRVVAMHRDQLTFRVLYEDGDEEDMTAAQVLKFHCNVQMSAHSNHLFPSDQEMEAWRLEYVLSPHQEANSSLLIAHMEAQCATLEEALLSMERDSGAQKTEFAQSILSVIDTVTCIFQAIQQEIEALLEKYEDMEEEAGFLEARRMATECRANEQCAKYKKMKRKCVKAYKLIRKLKARDAKRMHKIKSLETQNLVLVEEKAAAEKKLGILRDKVKSAWYSSAME